MDICLENIDTIYCAGLMSAVCPLVLRSSFLTFQMDDSFLACDSRVKLTPACFCIVITTCPVHPRVKINLQGVHFQLNISLLLFVTEKDLPDLFFIYLLFFSEITDHPLFFK